MFAIQWRPLIILVTVLALIFLGMRHLYRYHPLAFIFVVAFMRGLLSGARR